MPRPQWMLIRSLVLLTPILSLWLALPTGAQPTVETSVVASGFDGALGVTHAGDGSGRLFVIERVGRIKIWDGDFVMMNDFLDISALVRTQGEEGLLGLAFHPNYAENGLFYVSYSDLDGDSVIARYQASVADPDMADATSRLLILEVDQPPATNHKGGDLHFGPDGYLYWALGDGGYDFTTAQDATSPLGSLLRIDIDTDDFPGDPNRNYGIPAGNPFIGMPPNAPEIWNLGLRNPFRFSFDRATGDLLIGDVGEDTWEEVNFLTNAGSGGENFGWPCFEGTDEFTTTGCAMASAYEFPVIQLPHGAAPNNNCSVIGGYRYRGTAYPNLGGWYFYSDWCTGALWAAQPGTPWSTFNLGSIGSFTFLGFGENEAGELFIAGGFELLQITSPVALLFADGLESGDLTAWDTTVLTPGE